MRSSRPLPSLSHAVGRARSAIGYRRRFSGSHTFDDRSTGSDAVIVVVGGHKPWLSPYTLPRIGRAVPLGTDVCLVTPGALRPELRATAEREGWSYLSTSNGHVSLGQNLAVASHPAARRIYKLDEDIFVSPGYFQSLAAGFERVERESDFQVGFCAPILNVNGFSYLDYVRALGLEDEWEARFGRPRRALTGVPAHHDGEAAVWLWEHGLPFDRMCSYFAGRPFGYSLVPHYFSIGAILFERDVWDEMRGFPLKRRPPGLGEDEVHIAVTCQSRSRIIAVIHNVYAGHFSFGPQTSAMRKAFEARLAEF